MWNWNLDKNIVQLEICIRKIFSIIWRKYVNMVTTKEFKINKILKICMQIYNFAWRFAQCTIAYPHRCQSPRLNHMPFSRLSTPCSNAVYIFLLYKYIFIHNIEGIATWKKTNKNCVNIKDWLPPYSHHNSLVAESP